MTHLELILWIALLLSLVVNVLQSHFCSMYRRAFKERSERCEQLNEIILKSGRDYVKRQGLLQNPGTGLKE